MIATEDVIGYVAATLTALSFVPQAVKVIRTRKTDDLSLRMYVITAIGLATWLVYGVWIRSFPVIVSNSLTLVLVCVILGIKIRNG